MDDEQEWVVVQRFDDPVSAEVAMNFLRDHDITVALRGNSGSTSVLNRFDTVLDIRVVVPADQEADARAALAAMEVANADAMPDVEPGSGEETGAGPYRASRRRESAGEAIPRRRMVLAPLVLAGLIPGGGHFYARHNRTGLVICVGVISLFVATALKGRGEPALAALFAMGFDALAGMAAVSDANAGKIAGKTAQTIRGVAILVASMALMLVMVNRATA